MTAAIATVVPDDSLPATSASLSVLPVAKVRRPAPPVAADTDLRDYPTIPINVEEHLGSTFFAVSSDAEYRAGNALYLNAWRQVPAGSLPNDDRLLANLAGLGRDVESFLALKAGAMRGWILHSDDRYYHPSLIPAVQKAVAGQKFNSKRTEAARQARQLKQQLSSVTTNDTGGVTSDVTSSKEEKLKLKCSPNGEQESPGATAPGGCPACPQQAIVDAYHQILPTNPRVRVWNDGRQTLLRARWREQFAHGKFKTADEGVEWFRKYFAHVGHSRFLTGQAPARDDRGPFCADLPWLLKPEKFASVIEGKYHSHA